MTAAVSRWCPACVRECLATSMNSGDRPPPGMGSLRIGSAFLSPALHGTKIMWKLGQLQAHWLEIFMTTASMLAYIKPSAPALLQHTGQQCSLSSLSET